MKIINYKTMLLNFNFLVRKDIDMNLPQSEKKYLIKGLCLVLKVRVYKTTTNMINDRDAKF